TVATTARVALFRLTRGRAVRSDPRQRDGERAGGAAAQGAAASDDSRRSAAGAADADRGYRAHASGRVPVADALEHVAAGARVAAGPGLVTGGVVGRVGDGDERV